MDRIKIEYIYLAAIIAAFVAVLIIGFFCAGNFANISQFRMDWNLKYCVRRF